MDAVITVDLHGKNCYQAEVAIESALRLGCSRAVYRIRLIHGYRQGTRLKDFIQDCYSKDSRVLRLVRVNEGSTELVLEEWA